MKTLQKYVLTVFYSVLAGPNDLPGFWIFMYRVNPITYVIDGFLGTSLANAAVHCANNEFLYFKSPEGMTCAEYMEPYVSAVGGYLVNPEAGNGTECQYCQMDNTNTFLSSINVSFDHRWRNFGFMWAFALFNVAAAVMRCWLVRVPKKKDKGLK